MLYRLSISDREGVYTAIKKERKNACIYKPECKAAKILSDAVHSNFTAACML